MNVGDYINSGILQDFCLGLLTKKEEIELEAICHQYPEITLELRLLRKALEKFAGSNKVSDRIVLRTTVWNNIKKIWEDENS